MELVFLRHGAAADREDWKGDDADRPLTADGADRTKDVVRGLKALKVKPDVILSSPLLRARETAEIAKKGLLTGAKVELAEELAKLMKGKVAALPEGEANPASDKGPVDLLVIVCKNSVQE